MCKQESVNVSEPVYIWSCCSPICAIWLSLAPTSWHIPICGLSMFNTIACDCYGHRISLSFHFRPSATVKSFHSSFLKDAPPFYGIHTYCFCSKVFLPSDFVIRFYLSEVRMLFWASYCSSWIFANLLHVWYSLRIFVIVAILHGSSCLSCYQVCIWSQNLIIWHLCCWPWFSISCFLSHWYWWVLSYFFSPHWFPKGDYIPFKNVPGFRARPSLGI